MSSPGERTTACQAAAMTASTGRYDRALARKASVGRPPTGPRIVSATRSEKRLADEPLRVEVLDDSGVARAFEAILRLDGPIEIETYRQGGIMPAVLRRIAIASFSTRSRGVCPTSMPGFTPAVSERPGNTITRLVPNDENWLTT